MSMTGSVVQITTPNDTLLYTFVGTERAQVFMAVGDQAAVAYYSGGVPQGVGDVHIGFSQQYSGLAAGDELHVVVPSGFAALYLVVSA